MMTDTRIDSKRHAPMECPACGEISLEFDHFIREETPGDPGDVYTVGEEWECASCHQIVCF